MSLAVLAGLALAGLAPSPVRVEVHLGNGLPAFHVVGQADAGVRESRERVRAAIVNCGFRFPSARITVNLSPADRPKACGSFDLAIALGILLASGQICPAAAPARTLAQHVFVGELSLSGAILPVAAPLAVALGLARLAPGATLVMGARAAQQAALVPGVQVRVAHSLDELAAYLRGAAALMPARAPVLPATQDTAPCLSSVRGQRRARRVLELAACGRHHLLMRGPPGVGKSLLAQCLPGILPPLQADQALELMALDTFHGAPEALPRQPPLRAPHHSTPTVAMVGGGARPVPGEISRAHHGVLFLDELGEFARATLESLREPLESGTITVARVGAAAVFPCAFQLVGAMNACPCGWHGDAGGRCRCTPAQIRHYQGRVSGAVLDRVALIISLHPEQDAVPGEGSPGTAESSEAVRARVMAAAARQLARQGCSNARLDAAGVQRHCRLGAGGAAGLVRWASARGGSARRMHNVLRVARSAADLEGQADIQARHLAEALDYQEPAYQNLSLD